MRTLQLVNTCAHHHHIRYLPLDRSQVMYPLTTCPITVTPLPPIANGGSDYDGPTMAKRSRMAPEAGWTGAS